MQLEELDAEVLGSEFARCCPRIRIGVLFVLHGNARSFFPHGLILPDPLPDIPTPRHQRESGVAVLFILLARVRH